MDRAVLAGVGIGFAAIITANVLEGGSPTALLMLPPMLLVFGGTFGAALAGGTMSDAKDAGHSLKRAITWKQVSSAELVPVVVSLADRARREGLLMLESAVQDVDDEFLKRGVGLAVDGTDPEELREILEAELYAKRLEDKHNAKFFTAMGGYAPTIGIIGTVMGLVHVLESLSEPEKLGHSIAAAFLATLWGILSANLMWLPLGNRLARIGELEAGRMELVIEGVMAIQAGSNPRVVAQRLRSLLPERDREPELKAA